MRAISFTVVLLRSGKLRGEDTASAVQPRCHGSRWDGKRVGHVFVRQVAEGDKQNNVAVVRRERGKCGRKGGSSLACVGAFGEGDLVGHRPLIDSCSREGTQSPLLGSAMAA